MNEPSFLEKAERRLSDVLAEDENLAAQEESIRRQRSSLAADAGSIRASIALYGELMGATDAARPTHGGGGRQTLADSAAGILLDSPEPMAATAIVDALRKSGRLRSAQSSRAQYATLYSVLARDERFVREGPGRFALAVPPSAGTRRRGLADPGAISASRVRPAQPQVTLAEAAAKVLDLADRPLAAKDIVSALRDSGRLREGQPWRSHYAIVYSVLARDDRFIRPSPGIFALADAAAIREGDGASKP